MGLEIEINPQSTDDWVEVAEISKTAQIIIEDSPFGQKKRRVRIPFFLLNVNINARFIAVRITSNSASPSWVAGGHIAQYYKFPSFNTTLNSHYVKLNVTNLVELRTNENYSCDLIFYPRSYFQDITVKVWEYVGQETAFLESMLTDIKDAIDSKNDSDNIDLSEILAKLDSVSTNLDDSYLDITDDVSKLVDKLTALEDVLSGIDINVLTQLKELDAGIFTLAEYLGALLPANQQQELTQQITNRLNIDDNLL